MNFLTEKLGFEPELNQGLIASVVFHIALFLFAWFGVPHLFNEDLMMGAPPGLEAAIISDITAAPKVAREAKKLTKPKEAQAVAKPKPEAKKEPVKANPKPAASAPEPAPEQEAVVIPDQAKPKEEKKPAEKKPPEKKPEIKKPDSKKKKEKAKEDADFAAMMANLTPDAAAEPTPEEPKKKAAAEPDESSGPITENVSEIPLTAGEEDGIRGAIEQRWNIPIGMVNVETYVIQLRLHMRPDGTIAKVEVINDSNDPGYRTIAESARRAVLLTQQELGRLPIPPEKYNSTIVVRWNMSLVCSQMAC